MSVKMDLMNETTEILMEEHNSIEGLVNSSQAKLRMIEEGLYGWWQCRNNLFTFRIKECPRESYFDTSKITEILRMKLTWDSFSWQTEGPQTGQGERRKTGLDYT
jgi:hypothetical protein